MPLIFDEEEKQRIRRQLLTEGREMMLSRGITGMNLEELALQAGIAKGTFYRFFPTKQRFILEIIRDYQYEKLEQLKALTAEKQESLTITEGLAWYQTMMQEENPLRLIRQKDLQWILSKIPAHEIYDGELDQAVCRLIFSCMRGVRKDIDYRVVSNFPRIIMFAQMQKEYTHQQVLDQNIRMIIETMVNYIREEEP